MIYIGIVEDIKDPLRIGRTKVRVKGIHSDSNLQIPTKDLPWAAPMHPITSAANKGVGYGGCGVTKGSEVVIIFRDPGQYQQPVMIGTLPGLFVGDEESSLKSGYESDLGRIATNNLIEKTFVKSKRENRQIVESEVVNFEEPETPYATEYGESDVYMSRSGHVMEFDDTPSKERVHIYHRSGTFTEIHPDGTIVVRTEGDVFEINKKTLNVYTESNKQEFVGGNLNENIDGNVTINVIGNANVKVGGNANTTIGGNYHMDIGGTCNINSGGNMKFTAPKIDLN